MKNRFFAVVLAVLFMLSMFPFTAFAADGKRIVYVEAYGQASNGDGSRDYPFGKLSVAIEDLKDTGGEIVLLSDIDLVNEYVGVMPDVTYDLTLNVVNPEHKKCITIRSEDPDDRKKIRFSVSRSSATWTMGGPTIFENIYFSFAEKDEYGNSYVYKRIYSNGYPLVMGDGCDSGSSTYFHTGLSPFDTQERESDPENDYIVFKSGSWSFLFGPNTPYSKGRPEYSYYILGNASITGYIAVGPLSSIFIDKASLYVNTTGSVKTVHSAYSIGKGDVDVYLDKGTVTTVESKSLSGGTGDAFSCYVSGASVGKINGDHGGTMEETRLFHTESAKVKGRASGFDVTEATYKYSEDPYLEIEKKIEALKADYLTEKPKSEENDKVNTGEEGNANDPEENITEEQTPSDSIDPIKDFSDNNSVWLIAVSVISLAVMMIITLRKALEK